MRKAGHPSLLLLLLLLPSRFNGLLCYWSSCSSSRWVWLQGRDTRSAALGPKEASWNGGTRLQAQQDLLGAWQHLHFQDGLKVVADFD